MSTQALLQHIAFGIFEVDLHTGELWKAGFRVRLAGQPFRVLVVLLERPGEVVTREEMLAKVWGSNTNVDVEQAISGTIKKVREALGDSAESPRFIETLPKRGYRFIAPVTYGKRGNPTADERMASFPAQEPNLDSATVCVDATFIEHPIVPDQSLHGQSEIEREIAPDPVALALWSGSWIRDWSKREIALLSLTAILLVVLIARISRQGAVEAVPLYRVTQVTHYLPLSIGAPNVESFLTLGQDGDRIFTSVLVDGRSRLSAIFASTGGVQQISMPEEIASGILADITRDGSRLLVRSSSSRASEQPLWIVPSSGGSGQRVANVLAHDAAWMPDGTSILYANGNELWITGEDGENSTLYAKLEGRAFWLRWSPDGKLLRFTLTNPVTHTTSLWEKELKSGKPHPISELSAVHSDTCCGVWTADGLKFAFQANNNIWELDETARGHRVNQLTNGPLRYSSPAASRTGSQLYFVGLESPSGLQRFDEKHHYFEPATNFLANANRVEYSRDGRWVAWTDLNENLWRAHAIDGSDKVRLSSEGTEVFLAHWSPDGTRLAIMAREHGGLWQTYLVSASGGGYEALLKETRNTADPSWSPDGARLVFGREPDLMGKENGPRNLQFIDLGTHKTEVVPNSDGLFSPRWSPDGRWIVALTLDQKVLMLYDVSAKRWKQLAVTSVADPVWSADSKAVYIHAFQLSGDPILRVDAPDGTLHTVADLKSFRDGETANYFFSGLTAANEPLVQPRIGTGGLYSLDLSQVGPGR